MAAYKAQTCLKRRLSDCYYTEADVDCFQGAKARRTENTNNMPLYTNTPRLYGSEHNNSTFAELTNETNWVQMSTTRKLKTWFNKYKDPGVTGDEIITPEGYQKLCESLGYDMEGIEALVLMWKLGSKDLGTVTYKNWESGLKEMNVSSTAGLKQAIDSATTSFSRDPKAYKAFYRSTFNFLKSERQRTADVEYAKAVLPVVMRNNWMVPKFIEFLDENSDSIKSITRDQWQLLPDLAAFLQGTGNLAIYNTDDSWPKLYDDFVTWMRSRS